MSPRSTGFLNWKTEDFTDLDYTAAPLVTRSNAEEDFQFTEELRFASATAAPIALSNGVALKWQAGLFLFTQNYTQDAVNNYSPFVLSPFIVVPGQPALAAVRRSTIAASASTGRAPSPSPASSTSSSACAAIASTRKPTCKTFFVPPIAPPAGRQRVKGLLGRVAAIRRRLPRGPGGDPVRDGGARLQGGRLQRGVAGRRGSLRRGAQLELRRRREVVRARRPADAPASPPFASTGATCR